ncbi:uncharacterized protein A4U43_C08F31820 [Asparagus officinalis]|nr:uncharacterized protein A4U43_C08F31820 [Asparagus officinalis]
MFHASHPINFSFFLALSSTRLNPSPLYAFRLRVPPALESRTRVDEPSTSAGAACHFACHSAAQVPKAPTISHTSAVHPQHSPQKPSYSPVAPPGRPPTSLCEDRKTSIHLPSAIDSSYQLLPRKKRQRYDPSFPASQLPAPIPAALCVGLLTILRPPGSLPSARLWPPASIFCLDARAHLPTDFRSQVFQPGHASFPVASPASLTNPKHPDSPQEPLRRTRTLLRPGSLGQPPHPGCRRTATPLDPTAPSLFPPKQRPDPRGLAFSLPAVRTRAFSCPTADRCPACAQSPSAHLAHPMLRPVRLFSRHGPTPSSQSPCSSPALRSDPRRLLPRSSRYYDTILPFLLNIHFVLLISRQGKVRLTKWYSPYAQKERSKVIRELSGVILTRGPKLCNFVEWRGYKVVYRRYASLYFCMCIDANDNELEMLEIIHHFVEILDRYFGSVCELDLIFNFHKAYYILDEILIAGELQESSKKTVARLIAAQDSLVETAKEEASSISNMIAQATK